MRERAWAHDNNPCTSCRGWGGHIVGRGTDREDSQRCLDCRGTGKQSEERHGKA